MTAPDVEALARMLSDLGVPISVAAILGSLRLPAALAAADAAGYHRAVDRLRADDQGRGSALWTAFQWAADYLEGLETNQDASSTQAHEPQSAERVDIPAVPTVETPEAVRGAETPDLMAALWASLERAKAAREVRNGD